MSRLFDALQRSNAERSGDLSALLESFEQEATLEREIAHRGLGKDIAQADSENNEPPSATELMASVEQEATLELETALRGLGKNIAQVDAGSNEPPSATELMESVEQEAKLELETALRGLGKNIAQVDSGNNEPPSTTILASADVRTTPTITWPTPDLITYGNKLTFAQLNATASVEGTFVYTPDPGYLLPAGTHTLWVTFTPADSGGYAPRQAAVSIVVARATPALSWPTSAGIIYGAALSDAQLNASASVPGRFDYSPAPGEVLPPGMHTLSVTFTPTDSANYAAAQASVSLTVVARATPVIQWPTPDPITYGTRLSATQLCAVASVPGTFEYNPGLGAMLAAGEHKLSVVFTPADTLGYSTSQTAASLTVAKATPATTWPTPDPIAYGAAISATQLNATATVPGSFAYTPAAGEILEVEGKRKTARKKWMTVPVICAGSILLLLIPMIPLFHHGMKFAAKQPVRPPLGASDTPKPLASEPLTQDKPLATAETQQTTDHLPANEKNGVASAQVQSEMMNDQLTAPTQIPQGVKKPVADNGPPPSSFAAAGADGLGGGSANASLFNGHAQSVVKAARSKPFTISSGVATGMLIRKMPPAYPPIAKAAHVSGTVVLNATISKDGTIKDLHVVNGPAMLRQAAADAVRDWRYRPYRLNNQPVEVETTIDVIFTLGG